MVLLVSANRLALAATRTAPIKDGWTQFRFFLREP